jgi:hypothetical protein
VQVARSPQPSRQSIYECGGPDRRHAQRLGALRRRSETSRGRAHTAWHVGHMLGRCAWRRAQEDRAALAGKGILYALLYEDADMVNTVDAQLADPEAAVWALTGFGITAVTLLAEVTGKSLQEAHADVIGRGYRGLIRAWPGPEVKE